MAVLFNNQNSVQHHKSTALQQELQDVRNH